MLTLESARVGLGTFTLGPLDVSLRRGGLTALVGPNASGKTTLLRLLAGVLKADAGTVTLEGAAVQDIAMRRRAARCALVSQVQPLDTPLTVESLVSLSRLRLERLPQRVECAIEAMQLAPLRHRPLHALSVGQRQRAYLARALAQVDSDGVLMLDEPAAPLDPDHARRVWATLRTFVDAGGTVLASVHDLPAAKAVADDVWLLREGKLSAAGPADELLEPGRLESLFGLPFAAQSAGALPLPEWMSKGRPQV